MTDWTCPEDVPESVRDRLHEWLNAGNPADAATRAERAVADVIHAFWPAPAPTLAEELRDTARWWRDGAPTWEQCRDRFDTLAARAEQMEHDLAEARAEVERLTADGFDKEVLDTIDAHYSAPDQQANPKETLASSFPDPADVPSGEPWIVEVDGEHRTAVRGATYHRPWNTFKRTGSVTFAKDPEITLVSRFVPAPRVITDPEELDGLPIMSVVLAGQESFQRGAPTIGFDGEDPDDWYSHGDTAGFTSAEVLAHGPVTVLWEPGE